MKTEILTEALRNVAMKRSVGFELGLALNCVAEEIERLERLEAFNEERIHNEAIEDARGSLGQD